MEQKIENKMEQNELYINILNWINAFHALAFQSNGFQI